MSLKILHVISGLEDGGAEATLYNFIANSKNESHIVISLKDEGKYGRIFENNGIQVYYLNLSFNFFFIFKFVYLVKLIKRLNPNIVQTWMYHADFVGGCASYIAKIKNIFWGIHHTSLDPILNKRSTILIAKINSILSYFIPKKIITCAEKAKEEHLNYGFDKNKFTVIPNGIDLKKFKKSNYKRSNYRKKLGISPNEKLLGTVARFDPNKDHHTLIKCIKYLNESGLKFKYLLVGQNIDNRNKKICNLIRTNKLEKIIILKGKENDISAVMNALDLHILSSKSEAFPIVVLESIACGTACISTNVGDVKEIINNRQLIVEKENYKLLAKKIIDFLKLEKNVQKKIKNESNKFIQKKFSIQEMTNSYLKTYNNTH